MKTSNYNVDELPWFIGGEGSQYYETRYFPAAVTLNAYLGSSVYQPLAATYVNVDFNRVRASITYDVDNNKPVMVCGASGPNNAASHIPGYPNSVVGHWLVAYGYTDNGNTAVIADPAYSPGVINWSSNISPAYTISMQKATDYVNAVGCSSANVWPRGLIW